MLQPRLIGTTQSNLLLIFSLCQLLFHAIAIEIDNGVVGTPTIQCGTEMINFWVKTRNAFRGKVYVKGEYGRPECTNDFSTGGSIDNTPSTQFPRGSSYSTPTPSNYAPSTTRPGYCPPCPSCNGDQQGRTFFNRQTDNSGTGLTANPEMAHLTVKLGTCNVQRDRQLTPPGVRVIYTVVVSFHRNFVTKVDRAYQIQCAYMEVEKTVTADIDVSMPTTAELTQTANMPTCEYTIRRGSPDGPQIRFAKVGDTVYHRWECTSDMPQMFGILINNCYVDDGAGQRVQVLDDKGCSIDQFVLPNLIYEPQNSLLAYVEAHVFKFADRAVLDFQCAISICVRDDGSCQGVTPPRCERALFARTKRAVVAEVVNRTLPTALTGQIDENEWRLSANRLTVVDIDDDIKSQELADMERKLNSASEGALLDEYSNETPSRLSYYRHLIRRMGPRVCLSVAGFGVLVAMSTFVFTMAAVVCATIYILRRQQKHLLGR